MPVKPLVERGRFLQRSFDHLINTRTKKFERLPSRVSSSAPFVPPKDRIPLWNISHGDRVRVISGDKKGKIGTVDYVDRTNNRVFLNEAEFHVGRAIPTDDDVLMLCIAAHETCSKRTQRSYLQQFAIPSRAVDDAARTDSLLKSPACTANDARTSCTSRSKARRFRCSHA